MEFSELWWLSLSILSVLLVAGAILSGLVYLAARHIEQQAAVIWTFGSHLVSKRVPQRKVEQSRQRLSLALGSIEQVEIRVGPVEEKRTRLANAH